MRLNPALHVRVAAEQRGQDLDQLFAAFVQRFEGECPISADDLNRRGDSGHIPARIALRILIAGREIRSAFGIQPFQELSESAPVRSFRAGSGNSNPGGRVVYQLRHEA